MDVPRLSCPAFFANTIFRAHVAATAVQLKTAFVKLGVVKSVKFEVH